MASTSRVVLRGLRSARRSLRTIEPSTMQRRTLATPSGQHDTLSTYLLLSRPPTVLPSPTPFESAFFAYNGKLERALAQPFPKEFYFKKGSAAESQFAQDEKQREANLQAGRSHNEDESANSNETESSSAASPARGRNQGQGNTVKSRKTPADESGDVRSLERSLERTLFLLVRGGASGETWSFPQAHVPKEGGPALHQAAPEALYSLLGRAMDIWMITNVPVGIVAKEDAEKQTFVMRGHIVAGKPVPSAKDVDYAWVTREEMQQRLEPAMWKDVHDLLSA